MSYRNTIFLHYCYDETIVSKIYNIILDETCMTHTEAIGLDRLGNSTLLFYSKHAGGCEFEYFEIAAKICELIKDNTNIDICISFYIDGWGSITVQCIDKVFCLSSVFPNDYDIITNIDEAIEFLKK